MNNKGFTLIELIVSLAISSLILIMAIPSINNAASETRDKEYLEYKDSIIYGAKLYYRQRSSDISWIKVNSNESYYNMPVTNLKSEGFVKEFTPSQKSSNKKCNIGDAKVKITKKNGKVSYEISGLKCGLNKTEEIK